MAGCLHFSKAENEVEPLTVSPGECSTVTIRIAGVSLGEILMYVPLVIVLIFFKGQY